MMYTDSQQQKNKELLDICEKYSTLLDIPYFTMISNIYEPYRNDDLSEYNRGFIQEIYEKGIFDLSYRNAFVKMAGVDSKIKKWVIPIYWSDEIEYIADTDDTIDFYKKYVDENKNSLVDCFDIYAAYDLSDPLVDYPKVYNVYQNEKRSQMYIISSHTRTDGNNKYYGHKINILDGSVGDKKLYVLHDLWLTEGENSIKAVNTHFANDYINNFFSNKRIPQTKFNLGEEFFISRLIEDFKGIINEDNLDMDKLCVNELLETIKKECSRG